jgi:hypothetical protein
MDGLMDQIFSEDPYLAFQPAFAYTLPIQLLVSGITLTLLCVLAIHLICTSPFPFLVLLITVCVLTTSHDAVPLPPSPAQLHPPILFHPHCPHFCVYTNHRHPTAFWGFGGYLAL